MQEGCDVMKERYDLTIERIRSMTKEESVGLKYRDYFKNVAEFVLEIEEVRCKFDSGAFDLLSVEEMQRINHKLYLDIRKENYDCSYGNPSYAVGRCGDEFGALLSMLYAEIRGEIVYVFEKNMQYLTICNELLIEVYNCFEQQDEPEYEAVRDVIYWYASDYCDVFVADKMKEQIDPEDHFATHIIMESDLKDLRYLYRYGEYISDHERMTAQHLNALPEATIQKMADVYTEGYRLGFVKGNKPLTNKSTVNIHYVVGFERVVRAAIKNFAKMGLRPTIVRSPVSVHTKRRNMKIGYYGGIANKQYDYDHGSDNALFLDRKYIERRLSVIKHVLEQNKELAAGHAGPAVMMVFGDKPFSPKQIPERLKLTDDQEKLSVKLDSKTSQLTNEYMKGEERSFTIVAYPTPAIGDEFSEIFDEVIRINTLDVDVYEQMQQVLIDALDQGEYVHIVGKGDNKTDLKVRLHQLENPDKETGFENCVADVNIPVGEVFTSPVLEGTNGVLFVSKVFLADMQYKDLEITFEDGMVTTYTCSNFEEEEENKKYVFDNVLQNRTTLPMGEFAIGTNTTAYVAARKYGIEDRLPILIAEKMGPHFAVGDTCYSWSEDVKVFNPNGKEIVAKENSYSKLRKEDPGKAYFNWHLDITIPYDELGSITVMKKDGTSIPLLQDGRFVLEGTQRLNEPFDES